MKPDYFARILFRPMPRRELPTAILPRKLWQLAYQPIDRWAPVLFGHHHTYMRRDLGGLLNRKRDAAARRFRPTAS
jgi:hypothetical protein